MQALRVLVVIMGLMILAGLTLFGAILASRMAHHPQNSTAAPTAPLQAFEAPPIDVPRGARIEQMSTGADRLVLAVALADGSRQLIVIDLQSGRRLGIIPLRTAP